MRPIGVQPKIFLEHNKISCKCISQENPLALAQNVLLVHKQKVTVCLRYYQNCHQSAEKESVKNKILANSQVSNDTLEL